MKQKITIVGFLFLVLALGRVFDAQECQPQETNQVQLSDLLEAVRASTLYKMLMFDLAHNLIGVGWEDRERGGGGQTTIVGKMAQIREKYKFPHPSKNEDLDIDLPQHLEGSGDIGESSGPSISLKVPSDQWHELFAFNNWGKLPTVKYRAGTIYVNLKSMKVTFSQGMKILLAGKEYIYNEEGLSSAGEKPIAPSAKTTLHEFIIQDIQPTMSGYENDAVIVAEGEGEKTSVAARRVGETQRLVVTTNPFTWVNASTEKQGWVQSGSTKMRVDKNGAPIPGGGELLVGPDTEVHLSSGKEALAGGWFKGSIDYDGSKYILIGKVPIVGYTFDSNKDDPLTFNLLKGKGFVYQSGKGTITDKGGKTIKSFQ